MNSFIGNKQKYLGNLYMLSITILATITSCTSSKNKDIQSAPIQSTIIVDDLPLRLPGHIAVLDSAILITSPLDSKNILKFYDKNTGSFLFEGAAKGHGPKEILTPSNVNSINPNLIETYDINLKKIFTYKIDFKNKNVTTCVKAWKKNVEQTNKLVNISENKYVGTGNLKGKLFYTSEIADSSYDVFGKIDSKNFQDINNLADVFQGTIKTDLNKNYLAFSAFSTPYIALYKLNEGIPEKISERWFSEPSYRTENDQLRWKDDNITGFMDMTVTSNHIYALTSALKKEDIQGRTIESIPKILYQLDLKGNLLCKYELDKPLLRITNDTSGNLYGIALDERFQVVKLTF